MRSKAEGFLKVLKAGTGESNDRYEGSCDNKWNALRYEMSWSDLDLLVNQDGLVWVMMKEVWIEREGDGAL